jgi:capsular polysaccharide biosynthesis protein
MEETISLKEIFEVIKKRLLLITAFIFGAALIAAVVSYFVLTPTYESSSQFIVNQGEQDTNVQYSVNEAWSNTEIINTYNVIINSPAILDEVVEELSLPYSVGELTEKIQVSNEEDSQVVTVTATDESPSMAVQLANTTVSVFQENIPEILSVDNVTILSQAELTANPSPVAPNPMLNIAIAIVLGGMIGVGLAFLLEYLDNTITSEDDIEKKLELPVLGVISHMEDKDIREGQFQFKPKQNHQNRGGGYNASQKKSV